jgi:hypothetical protein
MMKDTKGAPMSTFAILIFSSDPSGASEPSEQVQQAHQDHADEVIRSGAMVAAFALQEAGEGVVIRDGLTTDGPFPESKEVVAGFYVVEAVDRDAAVEIGRKNPAAQGSGRIEVRAVSGALLPGGK